MNNTTLNNTTVINSTVYDSDSQGAYISDSTTVIVRDQDSGDADATLERPTEFSPTSGWVDETLNGSLISINGSVSTVAENSKRKSKNNNATINNNNTNSPISGHMSSGRVAEFCSLIGA